MLFPKWLALVATKILRRRVGRIHWAGDGAPASSASGLGTIHRAICTFADSVVRFSLLLWRAEPPGYLRSQACRAGRGPRRISHDLHIGAGRADLRASAEYVAGDAQG